MAARKTVRMLALLYSLTLLCLVSAAQGPNDEVTRPSPQEAYQNVLQIVKAEVGQEIDTLNETRLKLLEVSRLIPRPSRNGSEVGRKVDACQLAKMETTSEAVAEAFEIFTQQLDPLGTTAAINHTLQQIECFAYAQAKVSPGEVPLGDATLPPRPAITSYLRALVKRLNTSIIRLNLLNDMITIPSPTEHPSRNLLNNMLTIPSPTERPPRVNDKVLNIEDTTARNLTRQADGKLLHKLQIVPARTKKLAQNVETTETSIKSSEFENMKTLMSNVREVLRHTQSSSSISLLPSEHGPYCNSITIRGPVHTIMQKMLTEVSNAAIQFKNAVGANEIKNTRKELLCQMSEVAKFAALWSAHIPSHKVTGMLDATDSALIDLINKRVKKATQMFKQDDKTRNSRTFQSNAIRTKKEKTKLNIIHEVDLHPRCCD